MHDDTEERPTQPPPAEERDALEAFEHDIRTWGEFDARLTALAQRANVALTGALLGSRWV